MPRHRLFFALLPPDAVRDQLAAACAELIARLAPGGRPVRAELLHLTLAFLGEFARDSDAPTRARAAAAHLHTMAFPLALDLAASFPGRAPPWTLQPSLPPAALLTLQATLVRELDAHGFPPEARAFVPHLTFLRNAHRVLPPTSISAWPWRVSEFVLLDSRPAEHRYLELGRWPLAPAADEP